MKVVVFSDSHRDVEAMIEVVEKAAPDMIIHLGDHLYDAIELSRKFVNLPIEYVKGNCDFGSAASSWKLLEIEGRKIFITHGDEFGVRTGTSTVASEGLKREAHMILYGHTHKPTIKKKKGIILMNPGSIGRFSRGTHPAAFGIIVLNDTLDYSIVDYEEFINT